MTRSTNGRRLATAVGLYASVGLGLLASVVAYRLLGKHDFGRFATVVAAAALFESLLDFTVEESLTKYGFRYIAAEDWGRLRRLFAVAVRLKLAGALLALVALGGFAAVANSIYGTSGLAWPMLVVAFLPLVLLFGHLWGLTGAAVATLVSTGAFVGLWSVLLLRLRREVGQRAAVA